MATEIESLLVRIQGDASSYLKMIGITAPAATKKGAASITSRLLALQSKITIISAGIAGVIGVVAVKAFASFDQAMTESTSIMEVTIRQTKELRDVALSLSGEVKQGPTELAESYFFLASAGKSAAQSMALLPALTKFATAGAFDMATATDLLTDAQSALGLSSKNVAEDTRNLIALGDVLVKANTLSNATVQQFSESLTNTAAASLKSFGKGMEEGVALLAAYADQGIKGAVAGTNLSRVMLLLSKSARESAKAHASLGFHVFDASGEMRNFADIIQNLEEITAGMSDEVKSATLAQLGFAARVQQAILPLLGTSEAIREYERELRKAGGTTARVAEKQMKSFSNQVSILKNRVTALGIAIGEDLSKPVLVLAKVFTGLITGLGPIIPAFIALTAAAVSVNIAMKVGSAVGIPRMIAGLVTLSKTSKTTAVSLRALAVSIKAATVAAVGFIAFKATRAIAEAFEFDLGPFQSVAKFNRELERTRGIIEAIGGPKARGRGIQEQFRQAQLDVIGMQDAVKDAQRNVDELNTGWNRLWGSKLLELANFELENTTTLLKQQKKLVKDLAQGAKEQAEADAKKKPKAPGIPLEAAFIGAGPASIVEAIKLFKIFRDLQQDLAAAKEIERQTKAMEDGKRVTQQFLTPLEIFTQQQDMLANLFDRGAISIDTYNRGLESASEKLARVTEESKKLSIATRAATAFGGAEAAERITRFQEQLAASKQQDKKILTAPGAAPQGRDPIFQAIAGTLASILEVAREELDKETVEIEVASL